MPSVLKDIMTFAKFITLLECDDDEGVIDLFCSLVGEYTSVMAPYERLTTASAFERETFKLSDHEKLREEFLNRAYEKNLALRNNLSFNILGQHLEGRLSKEVQKRGFAVNFLECACCFKTTEKPKLCGGCRISRYCSKACQSKDWCYHKFDCRAVKSLQ